MKNLTILLFSLFALSASAQTVSYVGKLDLGAAKLNLVFNIITAEDGSRKATMDSPDQGAKGIEASLDYYENDSLAISVPQIMAQYRGKIEGKTVKGTFSQGGANFPLLLNEGSLNRRRPQTPVAPFPYTTQDMMFANPNDGTILAGTLTLPVGFDKKKPAKLVVLVSGSGQQNRDEEMFEHRPFAVIADFLARQGIATLRYDDRGVGESVGDVKNATTFNNMQDAESVINTLRLDRRFSSVGVLGHSEGGVIAFMLAARKKVDFMVSLAGAGVSGAAIIAGQNATELYKQGIMPFAVNDFHAALLKVFEMKNANKPMGEIEAFVDENIKTKQTGKIANAKAGLMSMAGSINPWFDYFIAYDPAEDIKNTTCPAFALNGEMDMQVLYQPNIDGIRQNLPSNSMNKIKTYPRLNHLFQHAQTGFATEYGDIEETISEEVLTDIAEWIGGI